MHAPSVNKGLDPWLVADPSAPMVHGAATAPPGSPPPPPPPSAGWLPPSTPTQDAVATGPSRRPHGYAAVPLRAVVNEEEALAFVSAPTGVVRLGAGMEGTNTNALLQGEMAAGSSSRAARRFGCLFGHAVAPSTATPSTAPVHGLWRASPR